MMMARTLPREAAAAEFAAFVDQHAASLARLAHLLLGDADAAHDLTADVFLAAWRQWGRISRLDYPLAYVRRMLTNQAATRHRRRARERFALERLFAVGTREVGYEPDGAAVLDIRSALQAIPPRRRACIVLRHAFDLSEREVAQILGITVGAVKSQTSKGLAQLRREFGAADTYALVEPAVPRQGCAGAVRSDDGDLRTGHRGLRPDQGALVLQSTAESRRRLPGTRPARGLPRNKRLRCHLGTAQLTG
jgi:RNA polymerase sigma-70 factor (sigma-E family)